MFLYSGYRLSHNVWAKLSATLRAAKKPYYASGILAAAQRCGGAEPCTALFSVVDTSSPPPFYPPKSMFKFLPPAYHISDLVDENG